MTAPVPLAVADASAVAALLFGEPRAAEVAERLTRRRLVAPTLLPYEVGSVCLRKIREAPSKRHALRAAHGLFTRMQIRLVEVPMEATVSAAEASRLSAYDAAYLWLARSLGCELVTLDRDLAAAHPG